MKEKLLEQIQKATRALNPTPDQLERAVKFAAKVQSVASQTQTFLTTLWPFLPKGKP